MQVTTRAIGDIPGITAPVHTPTLLEQLGLSKFSNADAFCAQMVRDIEDSREARRGIKQIAA